MSKFKCEKIFFVMSAYTNWARDESITPYGEGFFCMGSTMTGLVRSILQGAIGVRETTKRECESIGNYVVLRDSKSKNHYLTYIKKGTDTGCCRKPMEIIRATNSESGYSLLMIPLKVYCGDVTQLLVRYLRYGKKISDCTPDKDVYSQIGRKYIFNEIPLEELPEYISGRRYSNAIETRGNEGFVVVHNPNTCRYEGYSWAIK